MPQFVVTVHISSRDPVIGQKCSVPVLEMSFLKHNAYLESKYSFQVTPLPIPSHENYCSQSLRLFEIESPRTYAMSSIFSNLSYYSHSRKTLFKVTLLMFDREVAVGS